MVAVIFFSPCFPFPILPPLLTRPSSDCIRVVLYAALFFFPFRCLNMCLCSTTYVCACVRSKTLQAGNKLLMALLDVHGPFFFKELGGFLLDVGVVSAPLPLRDTQLGKAEKMGKWWLFPSHHQSSSSSGVIHVTISSPSAAAPRTGVVQPDGVRVDCGKRLKRLMRFPLPDAV